MKTIIILAGIAIAVGLILFCTTGCYSNNIKREEFHPNGSPKLIFSDTSTGFDAKWSSGDGKVINLPFANPSIVKAGQ